MRDKCYATINKHLLTFRYLTITLYIAILFIHLKILYIGTHMLGYNTTYSTVCAAELQIQNSDLNSQYTTSKPEM